MKSSSIVFEDADGREVPGDRYVNPDGSVGGLIPLGLRVPEGVWIHRTATILPGATLRSRQRVGPHEVIE